MKQRRSANIYEEEASKKKGLTKTNSSAWVSGGGG